MKKDMFRATPLQQKQIRRWVTKDKLTTSQIATNLGIGRSQAAGLIFRLGLTGHRVTMASKARQRPTILADDFPKIELSAVKRKKPPTMPLAPPPWEKVHAWLKPGEHGPLTLMQLRPNQCKWPVVEDRGVVGCYLFCGEPTRPDERYCLEHKKRAHSAAHTIRRFFK